MTINMTDFASKYLEQPRMILLLNRVDGTLTSLMKKEYDDSFKPSKRFAKSPYGYLKDLAVYFGLSSDFLTDLRLRFLKKKRLSSKVGSAVYHSTPRFNALMKSKGLWDEYVAFYIESEAADLSEFILAHELVETEASEEEYSSIGKLLEEYESYRFWEIYSDRFYFTSYDKELSRSGFVVLGNAGNTFGIAFYVGFLGFNAYSGIEECEDPAGPLGHTIGTLGAMVSLYCDEEEDEEISSPYGNQRYSSIVVENGRMSRNHLGTTTAKAIVKGLRYAIDLLRAAENECLERTYPAGVTILEFKRFKDVFRYRESLYSYYREPHFLAGPYGYLHNVEFSAGEKTKKVYSFCFRCFPSATIQSEEQPAISHIVYIGLLCDQRTGMIVIPLTVTGSDKPFIGSLAEAANKVLANTPTPKTIYVDSVFDYQIAKFIFGPYVEKGTEIALTDDGIASSVAYDSLCEYVESDSEIPEA